MPISFMKKSNRKGILIIISNANGWRKPSVFGGAEIITISLINKIEEIDWYIILPNQLHNVFVKKFLTNHLHYFPVNTLFTRTNVIKDLLQGLVYTWRCVIIGWKNRKNFDLIYSATTSFSDIFPTKIIALITGKPYIVKYHISIYDEPKVLRIYRNFREEKNSILDSFIRAILAKIAFIILKKTKNIVIVCNYLGKQLENCGIEKSKIKLNYNGLDFKELANFKNKNIIKKYDVCYMGRIEKNKGLQDMIEVVGSLKIKKPNISAVIIGDGSYLENVKEEIKRSGLESNIIVTGFLGDERYTFLQQSKIFVSPTHAMESFGLTLLEALFFDVPIISYTNPAFEEVFGGCESVKLISRDINLLQDSILGLLKKKNTSLFNIDMYSLENSVIREKNIIFDIM